MHLFIPSPILEILIVLASFVALALYVFVGSVVGRALRNLSPFLGTPSRYAPRHRWQMICIVALWPLVILVFFGAVICGIIRDICRDILRRITAH